MTEDEARAWIVARHGGEAAERISALLRLVIAENERQNLIAPSTIATIWARHVVDSAQLLALDRAGLWIDIGTGGGFPGMIVALLRLDPVLMVEPRKRRAEFLERCIATSALPHTRVVPAKIETVAEVAAVISARAVASLDKLLRIAAGCSGEDSRWLLPRGHLGEEDLAFLQRHWEGVFHVEQSLTNSDSSILVLEGKLGQ